MTTTHTQEPSAVGRCHRYPPVWVREPAGTAHDVEFPPVDEWQWCGEWRPAEVDTVAV